MWYYGGDNVHRRPSNENARRFGQLAGVLGWGSDGGSGNGIQWVGVQDNIRPNMDHFPDGE